jgi:oligopeptide transport system substrate-binding protein
VGIGAPAPLRPLASLLVAGVLVTACTTPPPGTEDGPTPGPVASIPSSLRLAAGSPDSLDPRDLDSEEGILLASQIFDGLVAYDPETLEVVPGAARDWEVLDGGRRFVFRLQRDATFHDGSPVTARDFARAWNRLADPLARSPFAFLLERVQGFERYQSTVDVSGIPGVRARGAAVLEVRLADPWPDFVSLLGHPALSPVPAGAGRPDFALQPAGNGPYRLTGQAGTGQPVPMRRFDGYYGSAGAVEQLEFRPFDEPGRAWPEFLAGELDVAPIPSDVLPDAESRFGSDGVEVLGRLLYCGLNQERLDDPRIGRAVSLALDREAIARTVYGDLAVPATAIVPPSFPGGREDPCGERCRRDLDAARSLVSELPRAVRELSLDHSSTEVGSRLAEVVAGQLGEAGFDIRPRQHEEEDLAELLDAGDQELACLVAVADAPRAQALLDPLYRSDAPENQAGIEDRAMDRLLDRARREASATDRNALYAEAEDRALRRMPLVPLVWFRSHLAAQTYVSGFRVTPLATYDAAALSIRQE